MNKLLLSGAVLCLGLSLSALAIDHDIATGSLTISDSASYTVTGATKENQIVVTDGNPTITLYDANIDVQGEDYFAFDIQGGNVNLVLSGSNNLKTAQGPGLRVASAASLTIDGEGSLTAVSTGGEGSGIGGKKSENAGAITINGGTIVATGASFGPGLGGSSHGVGNLTINGGNITANAGYCAAAIGGGTGYEGNAGNIIIRGGFVKANGGNAAGIGCGDCGGHNAYPAGYITITGGTIEASSTDGAGIGAGNAGGNDGRGPQIYISGGSIKATSVNGSPIGQGKGQGECPAPLTKEGGQPVYCATVEGAITDHSQSWDFSVKKDGEDYDYTYSGPGHSSGSDIYFYLPNGAYVVKGCAKQFEGTIKDAPTSFTRVVPGHATLSVQYGNITFTSEGVTGFDEEGNDASGLYGEYTIKGVSSEYGVTVQSGTQKITLDSVDIESAGTAFEIQGGNVKLTLAGESRLVSNDGAGLRVAKDSTLTVDGEGSLSATSTKNGNAGIGGASRENCGLITVNSGTIVAKGATYAAGIGGGDHAVANVIIEGGSVSATAGSYGAGIGGGTGYEGNAGNIIIRGGFVSATAGNGAGIGCGDCGGVSKYPAGQIIISGGTVEATSDSGAGIGAGNSAGDGGRAPQIYISGGSVLATSKTGSPIGQGQGQGQCPDILTDKNGEIVYCATLPGIMAEKSLVTITTTRDSEGYSYAYIGSGHKEVEDLYFYLPDGEYVVEGASKRYGGTIAGGDATFQIVPEPCFGLLCLLALGLLKRRF